MYTIKNTTQKYDGSDAFYFLEFANIILTGIVLYFLYFHTDHQIIHDMKVTFIFFVITQTVFSCLYIFYFAYGFIINMWEDFFIH